MRDNISTNDFASNMKMLQVNQTPWNIQHRSESFDLDFKPTLLMCFTELPSYRCEADHWKGATTLFNVTTLSCEVFVSRIILAADKIKFFFDHTSPLLQFFRRQRLPFLNPVIKNKLMSLLQMPETTLWKILALQRCHIFFAGWICLSKHSMTYFHVIFVIKLICVL